MTATITDISRTTAPQVKEAAERVAAMRPGTPQLGDQDVYLFNEGTHSRLYEKLGAHLLPGGGTYFAVWAPNADYVSVIGDFNGWDPGKHPLRLRGASGLWEGTIADCGGGDAVQVPHRLPAERVPGRQGRPVRVPARDRPAEGVDRPRAGLRAGTTPSGWPAGGPSRSSTSR